MSETGRPRYIQAVRTAVPERGVNVAESIALLRKACLTPRSTRLFEKVAPRAGIETRYFAALEHQETAAPLYRPAAEQPEGPGMGARTELFAPAAAKLVGRLMRDLPGDCLARLGTLVTVSCTHASSPGLEQAVFASTPTPPDVERWNLGFMGCSAGLAAVRMLHRMPTMAPCLIVACEISSLHFQYGDELDQMTANVLFSDGAAAVVLSAAASPVRIVDCRCVTFPGSADQMVWFADDHGLRLRLSQELPATLGAALPQVVETFLQRNGLNAAEVNHWLAHPGGPQILDSVQSSLRLPADALHFSRSVLRRFGNMSSPTIFFVLKDLLDSHLDGNVVAMAFGPGLTIELVLLRVAAQ